MVSEGFVVTVSWVMSCPIEGPERLAGNPNFFFVFGSGSHRSIDLVIYSSVDPSHGTVICWIYYGV